MISQGTQTDISQDSELPSHELSKLSFYSPHADNTSKSQLRIQYPLQFLYQIHVLFLFIIDLVPLEAKKTTPLNVREKAWTKRKNCKEKSKTALDCKDTSSLNNSTETLMEISVCLGETISDEEIT
ncbi:hypothetical protein CDAR_103871 [Caerostris darwini]|uniref:Uncharacterized protein n=1 Tax=Caerostris darwini TaxID=1538125 RepID=A0AAV4M8E7_9ARAC|nr:hypothetical protein CDAR_103871 [Caerostris darwini]